ncbi:ABC transporter permease [Jiangella mangrovi]|uniref:Osmoprotectant transport system permease protein n=1 Tax=Jiangella mangrovi TaxID=1524084 RepID=A0A7W9GR71_9ACTN|nr:ABC transporter permease subunit [Jiangella mangrovi]MBB5788537.1 osmoprotectant transport system permease protein [Jiangella mangrovi]
MSWLLDNRALVLDLTLEHARLSAVPIVVALLASIPLGWLAHRVRVARLIVLSSFNLVFTIPSLALFVLLPLLLGTRILDDLNVMVALSLYAIAMMLRGAVDGFDHVSPAVRRSATAMGYSRAGLFWTVQLPLAGPVLLATLRVVSVGTVSLLSVAALIGKGGLGYLFTNGFQRDHPAEIVVGIVFVLLVALAFDLVLVLAGRALLPWARLPKEAGAR